MVSVGNQAKPMGTDSRKWKMGEKNKGEGGTRGRRRRSKSRKKEEARRRFVSGGKTVTELYGCLCL